MSSTPVDLNTMPALAPPPGQISNFHNPENLNHVMYLTAAVGLSLSTAGVILRVFTKARVLRFMQAEEYILIMSLCGFYVFTGLMLKAVLLGQGTHQWNVSVAHVQRILEVRTAPAPAPAPKFSFSICAPFLLAYLFFH